MATKLNKKMRDEFLESALRDAFSPRFADLREKLTAHCKAAVEAGHPEFVKALKNKALRPYLALGQRWAAVTEGCGLFVPTRYSSFCADQLGGKYTSVGSELIYFFLEFDAPGMGKYRPVVTDPARIAEYKAVWSDLIEARKTLAATIAAYTTAEKFEADFPQLAKYLPRPTKTAGTAVAVQVGDVLEKLAKVGIPPAAAEETFK